MIWVLIVVAVIVLLSMAVGYYIFNSVFLYNDQKKGDKV